MNKCKNCGAELPDFAKFCNICGNPTDAQPGNNPQINQGMPYGSNPQMNGAPYGNGPQMNGAPYGNGPQINYGSPYQQQVSPKETASAYYGKQPYTPPAEDAKANKGIAICAYLGILWIVPLLTTSKHSPFAKFHTNQAILVFITSTVLNIGVGIFNFILRTISWRLYGITALFSFAVWVLTLGLMITGIVFAAQGKMKDIPVLGQIHILK